MKTGIAKGTIFHQRLLPKRHQFGYKMHWHLVDLQHVNDWAALSVKHQYNRWAIYGLYDKDYIDSTPASINEKIHTYLTSQGVENCDRVVLMTHPRYLGFSFNSVSFYFCYQFSESETQQLVAVVSEINNTPWGEKQLYCHHVSQLVDENNLTFRFRKQFHISPFVPMDIDYLWTFKLGEQTIAVDMKLFKSQELIMKVTLNTQLEPATSPAWFDFGVGQAFKMWLAIYLQAAKLWFKKIPFHSHPSKVVNKPSKHESIK